jgi:hypothetical protein
MTTHTITVLATLGVATIFAAIFYAQTWRQWPKKGQRGYRRVVSFSAGMAVAHVFVHLLPEIAAASEEFVEVTAGLELPVPSDCTTTND